MHNSICIFCPYSPPSFCGFFSLRGRERQDSPLALLLNSAASSYSPQPCPKKEQQGNCFSHCFHKAMLRYIRCLLLTIFIPAKDSTVSFLPFNHISRSLCEILAFHSPAAPHKSSCLIILFTAAIESPFQWLPILPVPHLESHPSTLYEV